MACDTCDTRRAVGNPPCKYHRIGSSNERNGGNTKASTIVSNKADIIDYRGQIVAHVSENSGCSASPQRLNRELGFNVSASRMGHYMRTLRDEKLIVEIDGRYYLPDKVPIEACLL